MAGSTVNSDETIKMDDGNTYPLVRVEISSDSHPFYTGREKFTQADGAVDRFNKKNMDLQTNNFCENIMFYDLVFFFVPKFSR